MRPEPQLLCVHLKHWPIDRLRRRVPALRHEPFVLIDAAHPRQLITAVSPELPTFIQPGMPLAQARAFNASLRHEPADLSADTRALEALARWLMRFTPNVALDSPDAILLDIAGTHRLFGTPHRLRETVAAALAKLRITAGVAAAPTPGAAWALAAYGTTTLSTLDQLPPDSLRLEPAVTQRLHELGLNQVGLLRQLPPEQLVSRFGRELLQRLDKITGAIPDPLSWLLHQTPITAQIRFDGVVHSSETIQLAVARLLDEAAQQLTRRGQGARQLRFLFHPLYAPPIEKTIELTRPSRTVKNLLKVAVTAIETVKTTEGFIAIRLIIPAYDPLGHLQTHIAGGHIQTGVVVDHLVDCLKARFQRAIEWTIPVESHLPEKAYKTRESPKEIGIPSQSKKTKAKSSVASGQLRMSSATVDWDDASRPLHLLTRPRAIRVTTRPSHRDDGEPAAFTDQLIVYQLDTVQGPERIAADWWNNHWETRDYFDVVDQSGARHWLFRVVQTRQWFRHGTFE